MRPLRVEPAVYTIAITLKFCQIGSVLLQACFCKRVGIAGETYGLVAAWM